MVKIYVHYEVAEPEFTMPVVIDTADPRTAAELKTLFVDAYNAKFGEVSACVGRSSWV
jgi:hypothetical protein